jgi:hydroxyacylglutathione hydrolase
MSSSDEKTIYASNAEGENKVQPLKFGHANIYLIQTQSGYILVDAGMPNMGKDLDEAFENARVDPQSVQLIVATHGHLDHVGSIAYAQKVTGGKVLCHRSFSDDLVNGTAEPAIPRNLLGRLLNFLTGLTGNKFEGTEPDILMDDEFDLREYGIAGKVVHTPGHSPSSVSIMLANGEALIGDLVRPAGSGEIGPGMFFEDRQVLRDSLEKVAAFEPRIIYLSHGTTIDNRALRDAIATI